MNTPTLNTLFAALAHEHRRAILYALALQPHSIHQLAALRKLSLPAIHKHMTVLEEANLISRKKIGRTNIITLNPESLQAAQTWLQQYQTHWSSPHQTLENYETYVSRTHTGKEDTQS